MQKPKLIILAGPTAVGKTDNSIRLAKAVNGEIISADSMQVYKRMDIGSAKIMPDEMQGVKHYLIDVLEPTEEFNIVRFQTMAKEAMAEIYAKGKIPVLVGGTGFYIQSLLYDIEFKEEEEANTFLRDELQRFADEFGKEALHQRLKAVDPESAEAIPAGNVKRVIRALEFYETHHEKISTHNAEQAEKESPYNYAFFVLTDDRKLLYERIEKRIDIMLEKGLIDEVKALQAEGLNRNDISMQGLGYKEILAYLEGEITLEEAVYILKRDTRHFAKRQITWFKREKDVKWLDKSEFGHNDDAVFEEMMKYLREKNIVE
ncbi:MAG: tRNA (adenosine(37)-N6)-dimethylallyltransferase MiaA [Lachnospiraceae bacterium]|nr:tRNA (adenosine(37)-N6)-dimethylallyltransferase MiaA [Lachnospiraceae bacterium]